MKLKLNHVNPTVWTCIQQWNMTSWVMKIRMWNYPHYRGQGLEVRGQLHEAICIHLQEVKSLLLSYNKYKTLYQIHITLCSNISTYISGKHSIGSRQTEFDFDPLDKYTNASHVCDNYCDHCLCYALTSLRWIGYSTQILTAYKWGNTKFIMRSNFE